MTLDTLKRTWEYFMNRSLKPIKKAESRLRPIRNKNPICPRCKRPVSEHNRRIRKEDIGLKDFVVECPDKEES